MGKRMAIGVGTLAGAVFASFGVYFLINWKEVETEYHVRQLDQDPDHLEQILDRPDGSPEEAAVLRYIGRPEGARHLLRLYVSVLFEFSSRGREITDTDQRVLRYHPESSTTGSMVTSRGQASSLGFGVEDDRLPILDRLVNEHHITSYEGVEIEDHEGLVFQVVRAPWVAILTGVRSSLYSNAEGYVCIVRKKTGARRGPPGSENVPPLLEALASRTADESRLARSLLAEIGCNPDDPVPYLLGRIQNRNPDNRHWNVAEGLSFVDAAHLPLLLGALENDNLAIRYTVLQALIKMEPQADATIPYYLIAARDEEVKIRDAAVEGLEKLGPVAIPALLRVLEGGPGRLHYRALNAIGRFGALAKSAVPAILAWIEGNTDPHMREKVAEIILQIEPRNRQARVIAREVEGQLTPGVKTPGTEDREE